MAKLSIEIEEDYPFFVFGISASASDYRVCWSLNKALNISLKREKPIELYRKGRDVSEHSFYTFEDESRFCTYRVVQNRSGNSVFLGELPKVDYLFITDKSPAIEPDLVLKRIREIRHVLMAYYVDLDQLKQKQNILLST
jgi:hypothetical protein